MMSVYVAGSAAFYVVTMIMMKHWPSGGGAAAMIIAAALIVCAFGAAAAFEIAALRLARLGVVYCAILGIEALLIAGVSVFQFGESYTTREIFGGAMIVAGVAVASSG